MMKIIFFGLGSIGNRQAKILKDSFPCKLFALRSGVSKKRNNLKIKELHLWKEVAQLKPGIAFITNPTFLHMKTALKCASLGMHLFIEKPISHTLEGIDTLADICQKKKLTCYTAFCLRFHPVVKRLKKMISGKKIFHVRISCSSYLPDWRDKKDTYSSFANKGGGVLLDLSHEFDYIYYLFGPIKIIKGVFGRVGRVTQDSEDFADVLIKTTNGININLHLNFFSKLNERKIIIDHEKDCIIADLLSGQIISSKGKKNYQFKVERNEYLKEQIEYFFKNIGNPSMMNNLKESKLVLTKILEFKKYGRENFSNNCS